MRERAPYLALMAESHRLLVPEVFDESSQFPISPDQELLELVRRGAGELVGGLSLTRRSEGPDRYEVGFWVNPLFARQGFVSEAVQALVQNLLQERKASKIEMRCDTRNIASQNLAIKLGFHPEALWSAADDQQSPARRILTFARYNTESPRDE